MKSLEEPPGKKTRTEHFDSFCGGKRLPSGLQSPAAFPPLSSLTWFCLSEHSSQTLPWASPPPSLPLKDAGSNIGVRVPLGDDRGLQFPDHVQLHHPDAELQEHGERVGGGKADVSARMHGGMHACMHAQDSQKDPELSLQYKKMNIGVLKFRFGKAKHASIPI